MTSLIKVFRNSRFRAKLSYKSSEAHTTMASVDCVVNLLSLQPDKKLDQLLASLKDSASQILLKGRPHGWVHPPHDLDKAALTGHSWDLFLLTGSSLDASNVEDFVSARVSVNVSVPKAQYDKIESQIDTIPQATKETPPLPSDWSKSGGIPSSAITQANPNPSRVGQLELTPKMVNFLSSAIPADVRNAPAAFMNFFKYPQGDSSVHDSYMQGFKDNFGDAAGATVKYMGPVKGNLKYTSSGNAPKASGDLRRWEDANLVQYDSVWHYAYMLSTDVYQILNKEKMEGLEDTCILLVSEIELAR